MAKVKFQLNRAGVRELLRSGEMMGICQEYAQGIQNRAGDGYEADTYIGKNRVNAMVYAATQKAKRDNLENNTLLKAVK